MTLPRSIAKTHSTNPKEGSRDSLPEGQQEAFETAMTHLRRAIGT